MSRDLVFQTRVWLSAAALCLGWLQAVPEHGPEPAATTDVPGYVASALPDSALPEETVRGTPVDLQTRLSRSDPCLLSSRFITHRLTYPARQVFPHRVSLFDKISYRITGPPSRIG